MLETGTTSIFLSTIVGLIPRSFLRLRRAFFSAAAAFYLKVNFFLLLTLVSFFSSTCNLSASANIAAE